MTALSTRRLRQCPRSLTCIPPPLRAQLRTNLKYLRASAGVLGFTTNCDLFVYMNGELVVNLGGVHASQAATLTLTQVCVLQQAMQSAMQPCQPAARQAQC